MIHFLDTSALVNVQLATALGLRRTTSVDFWSADARLCDAAEAEGLRTKRLG